MYWATFGAPQRMVPKRASKVNDPSGKFPMFAVQHHYKRALET
jgi:hypothetical protein